MAIDKLPNTPNVGTDVPKSLWDWLVKVGDKINQLVNWINGYTEPTFTLPAHADTHKTGGSDALAAADIGAASTSHKSTHATGGSDALMAADIGALSALPAGSVVQTVHYQTGDVDTATTIIPIDDTIPQNTEGKQMLSVAITPKSASNILFIDVDLALTTANNTFWAVAALFQDSTANALAADTNWCSGTGGPAPINFRYQMVAGTTAATTFKIRCGPSASGTVTINGQKGKRRFGGVAVSSITVTEVVA